MQHDAVVAWALLEPVFEKIRETVPNLKRIHFQSDGPATQYKNKTNFFLFKHHCKVLKLECASWNYTAAGHGKSAADGIGGTVKRMCDRHVTFGNSILCAEDIVNFLNTSKCSIHSYLVTEEKIKSIESLVPQKLESVKGTMKTHQVVWCSSHPLGLSFRQLSCILCYAKVTCDHFTIISNIDCNNKSNNICKKSANTPYKLVSSFEIGDWVVVTYDKWYPGEVTEIKNNYLLIKFFQRNQNICSWPKKYDIQKVYATQVLCKIDAPRKCPNKNNVFYIDDKNYNEITELSNNCTVYNV